MAQAKRASEQQQEQQQQPRKSKKPRTNRKLKGRKSEDGQQQQDDEGEQALGATSLLAQHAKAHAKDETELELEEAVFGRRAGTRDADVYDAALAADDLKRRAMAGAGSGDEIDYEQDDLDDEDDEETGLERLRDDNVCFDLLPLSSVALAERVLSLPQLFFVDIPPTASTSTALEGELDEGSDAELGDDGSSEDDLESDNEGALAHQQQQQKKPALRSRNLRQAAWFDPADEHLQISLLGQKRLRKLRDGEDEDVVNGLEYENRLRRQ